MTNTPNEQEIIRIAEERIAARREAIAAALPAASDSRSWRFAFASLLGVLLIALVAWPGIPLNWKMYSVVHGVCAQIHNVEMGGLQLPLCARNTGIYASLCLTTIYLLLIGRVRAGKLPPLPITILLGLFVVIMAVDGFNSLLRDMFLPHLYVPFNELRTLTGIGMGTALAVVLLLIFNLALRKDVDREQRVLRGWRDFAGALAINLFGWLAIYGNLALFYWPIAIVAWVGIVGVLFAVNLLVVAVIMRYEGIVERFGQLARPGALALIFTTIELGLLSWARFWMEGQGLVV
jgi:uncharacterized membrane protein